MFINTYQQTVNFITLFRFLMDHQNMYTDRHVIEMLAMKHRILFQAAICLKLKRDFFFVLYLLMIDLSLRRKCGKSIHCLMFVYHLGLFYKGFSTKSYHFGVKLSYINLISTNFFCICFCSSMTKFDT